MATNEMLDALLGMTDERRAEILALMVGSDASKLEALSKNVESQRKKRKKALERKAKENEKRARNEAIESFTVRVESWDGSDDEAMSDLSDLLDEAISLGGTIALDGFHENFPTFTVIGLATKKNGNKSGRPAKDAPTNFVDSVGNRVFGAITDFARANVPAETLEANYLKDVGEDFDHEKKKVPFKKAGAALAEQLVSDGYLVVSEYVAEDESDDSDSDSEESENEVSVEAETVTVE